MIRVVFVLCLAVSLWGCGEEFAAQGDAGAGGTAGTGGDAGSGGTAGTGGNTGGQGGTAGNGGTAGSGGNTGGQGGSAGTGGNTGGSGGQGGSGGDPCETGIYLTVDTYGPGGTLSSSSGPTNSTTFNVHGTSTGNELNVTVSIVNNLSADFTTPQSTSALESVRLRCQDPSGAPSYTQVCSLPLTAGKADCPSPGCYSASSGIVKMQLQIDPAAAQSGQVRVGIDPNSAKVCDDQLGTPTWNISP